MLSINILTHIGKALCTFSRNDRSCFFEEYDDTYYGYREPYSYGFNDCNTNYTPFPQYGFGIENPCYPPIPYCYPPRYYQGRGRRGKEGKTCENSLRDVELILRNLLTSLTNAAHKEIESIFSDLLGSITAVDVATQAEIRTLVANLEKEILKAVEDNLLLILQGIEKAIQTGFTKVDTSVAKGLATAKADVASLIETLGALDDVEIGMMIRDTTNGTQKQLFMILDAFAATVLASSSKQEKEMLTRTNQIVMNGKGVLSAIIMKYFKEFEKCLRALNVKMNSEVKKIIEKSKDKLETNLTNEFTNILNADAYLITSLIRKCIESLTGCPPRDGVSPFLLFNNGRNPLGRNRIVE